MKKLRIVYITCLVCLPMLVSGQKWTEIAVYPGLMYGWGDVNTSRMFYSPRPAMGIKIKRNINKQVSGQIGYTYGKVTGHSGDFSNTLPERRIAELNDWESTINALALQVEFNFLPYNPAEVEEEGISPFVFAGGGYDISLNHWNIPFGAGVKYRISKKIGIGIQWTFEKTFTDVLDNNSNVLENVEKQDILHNRDWFSHAGFFIAYNISNMRMDCPTYDQQKKRGRR